MPSEILPMSQIFRNFVETNDTSKSYGTAHQSICDFRPARHQLPC